MNCREFEELMDAGSAEAARHAETCPRCAARLADVRWLAGVLREVAGEARTLEAPPRVEAVVMRAFRERHAARRSWWPVWAAAAAALAVAGVVAGVWGERTLPPPPAVPVAAIPAAPAAPAPRVARAVKRPPRPARQPKTEVATEFIPLPYGSDLPRLERPRMLRMRLPRTALWSVGLPMNVERALEPVKADVVFDEDGMARAIRFVK